VSCSNHQKCANCKGELHSASSRDCPKWKLEKRVQQLKVERGISFPDARKDALSEQPTNVPRQTAASVVSTANSSVIQSKRKQTATVSVQTEFTWPVGTDTPVPVKVNSQSTQTTSQQKNTSIPSPPPRRNKAGNAIKCSKGNADHPTVHFIYKERWKTKNPPPPPHTDDQVAMYSRYGVLDVEGGGNSDAG